MLFALQVHRPPKAPCHFLSQKQWRYKTKGNSVSLMRYNIPMVRFDSNSLRWYHQPIAIRAATLARVTRCLILMVCMIRMFAPYWNTIILTVDNLCWCLFLFRLPPNSIHIHSRKEMLPQGTRALAKIITHLISQNSPGYSNFSVFFCVLVGSF